MVINAEVLALNFPNTTEAWWQRRMVELGDSGAIVKRGKKYFGTLDAVGEWLLTV